MKVIEATIPIRAIALTAEEEAILRGELKEFFDGRERSSNCLQSYAQQGRPRNWPVFVSACASRASKTSSWTIL
jgi:hypothetical protein